MSSTFEIVRAPPGLYSSLISTLNPSFFPSALAAAAAVENGGWWRRRRQGSSVYLLPFHSGVERTNIGSPLGVGSPPKLDRKEKMIFFLKAPSGTAPGAEVEKRAAGKFPRKTGKCDGLSGENKKRKEINHIALCSGSVSCSRTAEPMNPAGEVAAAATVDLRASTRPALPRSSTQMSATEPEG